MREREREREREMWNKAADRAGFHEESLRESDDDPR